MQQLLEGLKVLDLTRHLPGPFCSQLLADYGADVIKVESPLGGDPMREVGGSSDYFARLNRGKKSLTLNLKSRQGKEIFKELVRETDILLEGFRPGVMSKLNLGYADLEEGNPSLIYCAITGYGQSGSYKLRAGHDLNYLALAGILSITGSEDGSPVIPGVQMADIGGGLFALFAIMAAVHYREKTGKGQYVDISMLDGLLSWLPLVIADYFSGTKISPGKAILNGKLACYNIYKTKDNKYMSLAALEPKFWQEFCRTVGNDKLITRHYEPNQKELKEELKRIFAQKTRADWENLFADKDACCEPVLEVGENFSFRQAKERQMISTSISEGKETHHLGSPIKFSLPSPTKAEATAPKLGEHTREILTELGIAQNRIDDFRDKGVI